jgi:hypothetical protein
MKIKDAAKFQLASRKNPKDPVIGYAEPLQIDEVFIMYGNRLRIVREISKEEFIERLNIHKTKPHHVAASADIINSKVDVENAEDKTEVPSDLKYFYQGEFI